MQVFRRPGPPGKSILPGSAVTVGVFDGVHLGHRRILDAVASAARRHSVPSVVFTFEPTPQEMLNPGSPPPRLTRFREKYQALRAAGMDCMLCPPFDQQLASLSPREFIENLLVRSLGARHVVIGDDFRFARGRSGTLSDLEAGGRRFGYSVEQVPSVVVAGVRVSSTAIRAALRAGDLGLARVLLGHNYRMSGRVMAGQRLGRKLGFPTANVSLGRRESPVAGIFAVRVSGIGEVPLDGVASVGTRPTVAGREPLLEVHIFDFASDIYGRLIDVEFIARLRDEVRFPDLEALRRQMQLDAAEARRALAAS